MNRGQIILLTFDKGIVENAKQNIQFQLSDKMDSVLYMENYNPNMEIGSLVKRQGEHTLATPNYEFLVSKYSPGIATLTDNEKESLINHHAYLKTSNPISHKTHLILLSRKATQQNSYAADTEYADIENIGPEATGVIAYVPDENDLTLSKWKEPFVDGALAPGWYPIGTFQDISRYAENMVFCTRLIGTYTPAEFAVIKKYLYPCYTWYYHDTTKLRDNDLSGYSKYFNGVSYDEEKTWKVKMPSMLLLKDIVQAVYCTYEETQDLTPMGLNVYPTACEWKDVKDGTIRINDGSANDNSTDIQLLLWEQPNRNGEHCIGNEENGYKRNYEYFDRAWSPRAIGGERDLLGFESFEDPDLESLDWDDIDDWEEHETDETRRIHRLKQTYNNNVTLVFTAVGYYLFENVHIPDDKFFYWKMVRWIFPNYIDAKQPRPWLYGEEIPLVLTAIANGVEIVLYKGSHFIKTNYGLKDYKGNFLSAMENADGKDNERVIGNAKRLGYVKKAGVNYKKESIGVLESSLGGYTDTYHSTCQLAGDYNMLFSTVRMSKKGMNLLIENGVSELKLYIAKGDSTRKIMRSVGVHSRSDVPGAYYTKPMTNNMYVLEDDLSEYSLVKTYKIKGDGTIPENYDTYSGSPLPTNAWAIGLDAWRYAVPQKYNKEPFGDSPPTGKIPKMISFNDTGSDITRYPLEQIWSPDFIIWDYGFTGPPLMLESSGKYWDGIGAKLIAVVKGRTFLGGCIDKDNKEEQAIGRYSTSQAGVPSKDIFVKEDKMHIGHLPHTALIEFREQLIWFNREVSYRIMMPNILDITTWEFLETTQGTGTFSQKTVCVTPKGIIFCNENGIWISDGGMPESLSNNQKLGLMIEGVYQSIAMDTIYPYKEHIDIGQFLIDETEGFNRYMELEYNIQKDELVLSTPVSSSELPITDWTGFDGELRMILNFKSMNWRMEHYSLKPERVSETFPVLANPIKTFSSIHRLKVATPGIQALRAYSIFDPNNPMVLNDFYINFAEEHTTRDYDSYADEEDRAYTYDPICKIITHEIGDGKNDYLLNKIIVEAAPRHYISSPLILQYGWNTYNYATETYKDPKLNLLLRNKSYESNIYNEEQMSGETDLIALNFNVKTGSPEMSSGMNPLIKNPFTVLQTPGLLVSDEDFGTSGTHVARESMVLLTPMRTKFRRCRLEWESKYTAKFKSLKIDYTEFVRRSQ